VAFLSAQHLHKYTLKNRRKARKAASLSLSFLLVVPMYAAERVSVKIVDRQNITSHYTSFDPGHSETRSTGTANCFGSGSYVNCSGNEKMVTTSTPAQTSTYELQGATFSLALPDSRIVVVTCDSKHVFAKVRSCRMPTVNDIQAEFKGDKAKLFWPVSIDGKKLESETYKIINVIDRPSRVAEGDILHSPL